MTQPGFGIRDSGLADPRLTDEASPGSRVPGPERTVAALGEHALIARIRARVPPDPPYVRLGIGDDAAVVEPARNTLDVVTTDCLLEGVHFDMAFASPADIGYKALAVNLSDLAAMGAAPRLALLSLALPDGFQVAAVDGLLDGLLELAAASGVALVGGNVARSPGPLMIDITALGSVKPRRVLARSGARPGDDLYVSGRLGASTAGLASFRAAAADPAASRAPSCERRHLRPDPRVKLGTLLGRTRTARACIDLSDGLADGIRQLTHASDVGAVVEADAIPVDPDAREWLEGSGRVALDATLAGGEDYELLFSVAPRQRRQLAAVQKLVGDLPITCIGRIVAEPRIELRREGRVDTLPEGFVHFAGGAR